MRPTLIKGVPDKCAIKKLHLKYIVGVLASLVSGLFCADVLLDFLRGQFHLFIWADHFSHAAMNLVKAPFWICFYALFVYLTGANRAYNQMRALERAKTLSAVDKP